ncbi:MotB family protein [Microvirga guangxiensis]|uniref:Chemotaxis protein MotB n=1 Tax=Microvirga guangxiensis TaxID=549386 RepID=A0A1G5CU78_9HYPH|nr:MotB family protein [Microvirga guangxiensis]SCY06109.1 chemotaxis protein MotB [Microvirga guangxiensis]
MLSSGKQEILVIRRGEDDEVSVKGGAWKIAHADFMTAMMAFFLIMWLVGMADHDTKIGVANYFNPVQLANSTSNKKGLDDPQNVPPERETENTENGKEKGSGQGTGGKSQQLQKPRFKEGALFQDPYAVLAKIADEIEATPHDTLGADVTPGESDIPGLNSGEAFRDPFDPLYWQVAPIDEMKADVNPKPGTATPAPTKAEVDAWVAAKKASAPDRKDIKSASASVSTETKASSEEQQAAAEVPPLSADAAADLKAAELKKEIMNAVQPGRNATPRPQIEVRRTGAGTVISLTDDIDFSMFAVGSAEPHAKVVQAMAKIAAILQSRPGKIVIRGHTDSRPFKSADYDNWRLSHARAQMALYMLVRGGLDESRIVRVEGHADRDPKIPTDSKADQNRRVEILLQE